MKFNTTTLKNTLIEWKAILKAPDFLHLSIKFCVWLIIPIGAYFPDFSQVFSLALSDSEAQYVFIVPFAVAYFFYRRRKAFTVSRPATTCMT